MSTKKYKSTSRTMAYRGCGVGKKTPEESNTINSLLFRTFSPTKMCFLSSVFCDSILLDGNLYQESATWSKKSCFTTTGNEGREEKKNPQNCIREEKKLEDLICFLFANWRRGEKKKALDALCVFSFVLRQSFLSGPPLRLDARRRSTYKRIDTNVLHLR